MRILPKTTGLRKSELLYRRIRHRRGHGVHSPFAFHLITKVIEEKSAYYSFRDIELLRKKLLYREDTITFPDRRYPGQFVTRKLCGIVAKDAIKPKYGALLFRLANYFKPVCILQIGPSVGLSTLYLTSYSKGLTCISLENDPAFSQISEMIYHSESRNQIDLRIGSYDETLPGALKDMDKVDFVYFNTQYEHQLNGWMIEACMEHIHPGSVFIIKGIKANNHMRELWKKLRNDPRITISLDLYSFGILVFNPKLHKRNYKVYF